MRLINESDVLEKLNRNSIFSKITNSSDESAIDIVENSPTAYDVNKVVEQLADHREELLNSNDYPNDVINYCLDWMDDMIDIVKAGGR